jgi:hypothetical protein
MLHVKNSVGQPFHFSYFHWDYDHLRAVEGLHPDYYFDKFYQIPRLRTGQVKSNGKMSDEQLKNLDLI